MCAGISFESRTELVVVENGTLTADGYATEILNDYVGPFLVVLGENAVFLQDNARPYTIHIVFALFEEIGITHME